MSIHSNTPIEAVKYKNIYVETMAWRAHAEFGCCTIGDVMRLTDKELKTLRSVGQVRIRIFREWCNENVIDVEIRFDKETPTPWRWLA